MRSRNKHSRREYAQLMRIDTWERFLCHLSGLEGYSSEQTRCHVAMLAAIMSNQRHDPETGFLKFLPDTPLWVLDLDAAMYAAISDGVWGKMDERYQAGKVALARHFDVSFMP
jgi:hypothetical protein